MTAPRSCTDTTTATGCPLRDGGPAAAAELAEVTRRHFLSVAALSAIAATLAGCGGGALSAADRLAGPGDPATPTPTPTPNPTNPPVGANQIGVTVASFPALQAVGGVAKVNNSPAIAVARTAAGFVAFSLRCPHSGTTVTVQTNNTLRCKNHDALFTSTGVWTGGQRTTNLVPRTVVANATATFLVVNLS